METNKAEKNDLSLGGGASVASIFIILAIASIAVALIFWGISLGRKYQASSVEKKLANVESETAALGNVDLKAKQINEAEKNVEALNSSKNYWSVLLAELAAQTTKNMVLNEMTANDQGQLTITGSTVSYEALAKFMTALRSSGKFSDVELTNATLAAEGSSTPITISIVVTPNGSALSKNQ